MDEKKLGKRLIAETEKKIPEKIEMKKPKIKQAISELLTIAIISMALFLLVLLTTN